MEEAVDILMDSIQSKDMLDQKKKQFAIVLETVNKYIKIIQEKISVAQQLFELVESNSK